MFENKIIHIKKNSIIFWIFWVCFYPPPIIGVLFPVLDYSLRILKVIILIAALLVVIYRKRLLRITLYEVSIIAFAIYGITINICNNIQYVFTFISSVLMQLLMIALMVQILSAYNRKELVYKFTEYITLLVWINLVLMLVFPSGITKSDVGASVVRAYWLLGSKNVIVQDIPIYLLAIGLEMQQVRKKYIGMLTLFVALISFSSMGSRGVKFLGGSTTAMIIMFIFMLLYILWRLIKINFVSYIFSAPVIAIGTIAISFILHIIGQGKLIVINTLIELSGKNYTFSYRNTVWETLYRLASKNALFGIGNTKVRFPLGNFYAETCYSFWGANWLRYGIIGVSIIVLIFYFSEKQDGSIKLEESLLIQFALFFLLVGGLMNEIGWKNLAVLLALRRYACGLEDDLESPNFRKKGIMGRYEGI